MLGGAKFTADEFAVPAVVVAWDRKMKVPWCPATTLSELTASEVVERYGKRFTIEETFRQTGTAHAISTLQPNPPRDGHRAARYLRRPRTAAPFKLGAAR